MYSHVGSNQNFSAHAKSFYEFSVHLKILFLKCPFLKVMKLQSFDEYQKFELMFYIVVYD